MAFSTISDRSREYERSFCNSKHNLSFSSFSNVINGQLVGRDSIDKGIDPVTELELWDVLRATKQDIDKVVASARNTFKSWKLKSWEERKRMLLDFVDGLRSYEKEFTELLMKETGKPVIFDFMCE